MDDIVTGNGRLLARLDERTENIQQTVGEIKQLFVALDDRVRRVETEVAAVRGRWSVIVLALSAIISVAISLLTK